LSRTEPVKHKDLLWVVIALVTVETAAIRYTAQASLYSKITVGNSHSPCGSVVFRRSGRWSQGGRTGSTLKRGIRSRSMAMP